MGRVVERYGAGGGEVRGGRWRCLEQVAERGRGRALKRYWRVVKRYGAGSGEYGVGGGEVWGGWWRGMRWVEERLGISVEEVVMGWVMERYGAVVERYGVGGGEVWGGDGEVVSGWWRCLEQVAERYGAGGGDVWSRSLRGMGRVVERY